MKKGMKSRGMSNRKKTGIKYFLFSVPFLLFVFAFCYIPLIGWALAFFDYRVGRPFSTMEFVGLDHFIRLFTDSDMVRIVRNTLVMSFLKIGCSVLPMGFAIMLNDIRHAKTKKVVQTVTTLPNFIRWIVVYGLAFSLFSSQGLFKDLCGFLHISYSPFGLLGDEKNTWWFQQALYIWKTLGWETIIYMAAIVGIDSELYDAAKVDGANKMQLIRYITIPGLMPTFIVLLLLNVSNLLNNGFEQYYVFWNSLVSSKIEVMDYYIYKLGFQSNQYSYSIAICVLKSLISIGLLFLVNQISKKTRGSSLV